MRTKRIQRVPPEVTFGFCIMQICIQGVWKHYEKTRTCNFIISFNDISFLDEVAWFLELITCVNG